MQRISYLLPQQHGLMIGMDKLGDLICSSIRHGDFHSMRDAFIERDTLLIDNLWTLSSRPYLASEVCRLIRKRQEAGRLTIVASDIPCEGWAEKNREIFNVLDSGCAIQVRRQESECQA